MPEYARRTGDVELLREVVGLFVEEAPELLSAIREAIADRDSMKLKHAAHFLKGTVSSLGARAAREAALRLEVVGRSGDLTYAEPACAELEKEIASLTQALTDFRKEQVV